MLNIQAVKDKTSLFDLVMRDTNLKKVGAQEYAGPCIKCGGEDRFHLHVEKGWFCRICTQAPGEGGHWRDEIDFIMWRDSVDFITAYEKLGGDTTITPEESARLRSERTAKEQERREEEKRHQEERRKQLDSLNDWEKYYHNLAQHNKKELWYARGLTDQWIDYFKLGYCDTRMFGSDSGPFESPSLTIPTFQPVFNVDPEHPHDFSYTNVGLVHRLLINDPPGGKYRPHMAGTGKPLFKCNMFCEDIRGDVLLVEGEIKAAVTFAKIYEWANANLPSPLIWLQIVGAPGKSFKRDWVNEFENADRIWICLDPDASDASNRVAEMLGKERCRIIELTDKIDDMLVDGLLSAADLPELMTTARRVT